MKEDIPQYYRYYTNINEYCELGQTANKACHYAGKTDTFEAKGYLYFKQSGLQYKVKL